MSAGAPFPHCGAAHGASGGPRAPPELTLRELSDTLKTRVRLKFDALWARDASVTGEMHSRGGGVPCHAAVAAESSVE